MPVLKREVHRAVALLACAALAVVPVRAAEDEKWTWPEEEVDEGSVSTDQLAFLPEPPDGRVHHHHNRIVISRESLVNGWVHLHQCHKGLDPVERIQVVFSRDRSRGLTVHSSSNIEKAWIEGSTVQLYKVGSGATLCIEVESRALWPRGNGTYVLRNGPYMRRFLDGYYPMHVTMVVQLPNETVALEAVSPRPQPGFEVRNGAHGVSLDAWFTGRLVTELTLRARH